MLWDHLTPRKHVFAHCWVQSHTHTHVTSRCDLINISQELLSTQAEEQKFESQRWDFLTNQSRWKCQRAVPVITDVIFCRLNYKTSVNSLEFWVLCGISEFLHPTIDVHRKMYKYGPWKKRRGRLKHILNLKWSNIVCVEHTACAALNKTNF